MIILGFAVICGVGAFLFSNQSKPGDRATEAMGAAAGGALGAVGCLFQLILGAIPVAIGLALLSMLLRSCS